MAGHPPAEQVRAVAFSPDVGGGRISLPEEARTLRWIWCFGDLIANTDMHRANVSFWFDDQAPYQLTPFYDLLPMQYAPGAHGDLSERAFSPRPPLARVADIWSEAASAALEFWERVSAEETISKSFRVIADINRTTVVRMLQQLA